MKVRNNEARVHILGGPGDESVRLAPGINEVDAAAWAKAVKNPGEVLQHLFKQRILEVLDDSGAVLPVPKGSAPIVPPPPAGTGGDLSNVSVEAAKDLIAEAFDRDTLNRWKAAEKRKEVIALLDAQLEITKPEPKKK